MINKRIAITMTATMYDYIDKLSKKHALSFSETARRLIVKGILIDAASDNIKETDDVLDNKSP
jgi:hypothetical protein